MSPRSSTRCCAASLPPPRGSRPELDRRRSRVVQKAELPPDRPGERSGGTYGMSFDPQPDEPVAPRYPRPLQRRRDERRAARQRRERQASASPDRPRLPLRRLPLPAGARDGEPARPRRDRPRRQRRRCRGGAEGHVPQGSLPRARARARSRGMGTFVVKSNTYIQIENIVRMIFGLEPTMGASEEEAALGRNHGRHRPRERDRRSRGACPAELLSSTAPAPARRARRSRL